MLAIFGDIDLAEAEAMVRQEFSSMAKGEVFDLSRIDAEPAITAGRKFQEQTPKNGAVVT